MTDLTRNRLDLSLRTRNGRPRALGSTIHGAALFETPHAEKNCVTGISKFGRCGKLFDMSAHAGSSLPVYHAK
jgi:hypothetical protein